MALVEVMRELAPLKHLVIRIAHIHHMLRPLEADVDRTFVRTYARLVDIPYSSTRVDVPTRRKRRKESIEEAARHLRYAALERLRTRHGMNIIATGHHADDQVETVLMRVSRGSDVRGLAGILPRLGRPPVVRPLLFASRKEIMSYLAERRIPYRMDSTNEDLHLTRNWIRGELIPQLERYGDRPLLSSIPRFADAVRRFGAHLQDVVPLLLSSQTEARHGHLLVSIDALRTLGPGLVRSYVGMILTGMGVDLSRDRIERVLRLAALPTGRQLVFRAADVRVLRDRDHLVFGHTAGRSRVSAHLRAGGQAYVAGALIQAGQPGPPPRRFGQDRSVAWVDASQVGGGFVVRPWRPGDRFQPLGMKGRTKKVSDILRDAHVPLYYKESIPVVTHRGRIVWVCGIRPDERFRLTAGTKYAIQLTYHPSV